MWVVNGMEIEVSIVRLGLSWGFELREWWWQGELNGSKRIEG